MAPSNKRKRKPLPKRACPCCGSILSEKTIEHHAAGTHVPTRINVTLVGAAQKHELSSDILADLSGDSSDIDIESSGLDFGSEKSPAPASPAAIFFAADEDRLDVVEPEIDHELEEIVENTWSGRRATVEDYESDDEEEDYEGNNDASEPDSEREWEQMGVRNGLEMDDLVDEDFQRIVAEFGALLFYALKVLVLK